LGFLPRSRAAARGRKKEEKPGERRRGGSPRAPRRCAAAEEDVFVRAPFVCEEGGAARVGGEAGPEHAVDIDVASPHRQVCYAFTADPR
jgi:hypothetical protein